MLQHGRAGIWFAYHWVNPDCHSAALGPCKHVNKGARANTWWHLGHGRHADQRAWGNMDWHLKTASVTAGESRPLRGSPGASKA